MSNSLLNTGASWPATRICLHSGWSRAFVLLPLEVSWILFMALMYMTELIIRLCNTINLIDVITYSYSESGQASHLGPVSQKCNLDRHLHHKFSIFPESDLCGRCPGVYPEPSPGSPGIKEKPNKHTHHQQTSSDRRTQWLPPHERWWTETARPSHNNQWNDNIICKH